MVIKVQSSCHKSISLMLIKCNTKSAEIPDNSASMQGHRQDFICRGEVGCAFFADPYASMLKNDTVPSYAFLECESQPLFLFSRLYWEFWFISVYCLNYMPCGAWNKLPAEFLEQTMSANELPPHCLAQKWASAKSVFGHQANLHNRSCADSVYRVVAYLGCTRERCFTCGIILVLWLWLWWPHDQAAHVLTCQRCDCLW